MAELSNARIDELPLGNPQPGDFLAFRDMINGVTKKVDITPFLTSSTGNFEWSSSAAEAGEYDDRDVVTYGGNWYQSEINNNESIPGADANWTQITKSSSGLVYWEAGVFTEDKVFVLSEHRDAGFPELYFLTDATRPFVSADIAAEEEDGQWRSITELTRLNQVDGSDNEIVLDFKGSVRRKFSLGYGDSAVEGDKEWQHQNDFNALEYSAQFEVVDPGTHTFPSNHVIFSSAGLTSANTWQVTDNGIYKMSAWYDGTNWLLTIEGPQPS